MKFPKQIEEIVSGLCFTRDSLGRSGDETYLFEDKYVLKCSQNPDKLKREYDRSVWLSGKLPVAKPVCFLLENDRAYFLREMLCGKPLCSTEYLAEPALAATLLAKAFLMLRQVDATDCPFVSEENEGEDFVHGDLCLPNILVDDGEIAGFIDLENCGRGDKNFDISWAVWSLGYNLGTSEYTEQFLSEIDCPFSCEKYEKYVIALIDEPKNAEKYRKYIPEKYR